MIVIIDYGVGNLRSVQKSLQIYYPDVIISSKAEEIESAVGLVLPGVGSFGDSIEELEELGLYSLLRKQLRCKFSLGICLGMQLLFESSEESPGYKGLELLKGHNIKLQDSSVRVPHQGWNKVIPWVTAEPVFSGYAYFSHTYSCQPQDEQIIRARTLHGSFFPSIIEWGTILATQFHPEKSKTLGYKVLKYYISKVKNYERDNSCN